MTIRVRLTVLYATAFFIAGAVLIALMYFYLDQSMDRRPGAGAQSLVKQFLAERGLREFPVAENLVSAFAAQAEQQREDIKRGMLTWSFVSLGVVGLAAGGFGWLLAGRALQPLHQITTTARRVADRSLHERIGLDGPDDEIKDLADTFDAMLERLDHAFDGQRRFVANASHELRTPLTINRTLIEVAIDDPDAPESTRRLGATLLDVNRRHERLIDGLLVLASSQQQLARRVRVDLADIARRVVALSETAAAEAGVEVIPRLTPSYITGDPDLLERLVGNLIDNAIRYNRAEAGWAIVSVSNDEGASRLSVENSGSVIPQSAVDGIFEPFHRLSVSDRASDGGPTSRGAGLGLSIVRSIATAHGGEVRAVARPDGGLTVTFVGSSDQ
ncbi:sensor histidine kinase [Mycolicibacterium gadium]|uniref:histidine kinase n=1 Tax=Mycolicibacterium gadium TaxID=1794 RepID=A0A7I7WGL2_MYCGU|nr:ATP-binding protein [Mycolicibacterium gadium]BBZ16230.1 two-component sensor histidine kinase [Mycolicibacterium gadium]